MLELVGFAIRSFNARRRNPDVKKPTWRNMYMPVEVKKSLWSDLYVLDINEIDEYSREALAWLMLNCTDPMVPLRTLEARFGYGSYGRKMFLRLMQYPRHHHGDCIYPNPTSAYITTGMQFIGDVQYYMYCHLNCYYWTHDKFNREMLKDLFDNHKVNPEMSYTLVKADCYKSPFRIEDHGSVNLADYLEGRGNLKNLYVLE